MIDDADDVRDDDDACNHDYEVQFTIAPKPLRSCFREPSWDVVTEISGVIIGDDDTGTREVGTLEALYLRNDADNDLQLGCDAHSAEATDVATLFYTTGNRWQPNVRERIKPKNRDLLYLATIEIDDGHRGRDLGLRATWELLRCFGGGSLVICRPFPMQHTLTRPVTEIECADAAARIAEYEKRGFRTSLYEGMTTLVEYWERLGFKHYMLDDVRWSGYLYLDLGRSAMRSPYRRNDDGATGVCDEGTGT